MAIPGFLKHITSYTDRHLIFTLKDHFGVCFMIIKVKEAYCRKLGKCQKVQICVCLVYSTTCWLFYLAAVSFNKTHSSVFLMCEAFSQLLPRIRFTLMTSTDHTR